MFLMPIIPSIVADGHQYYVGIIFSNYLFNFFNGFPAYRYESAVTPNLYYYQLSLEHPLGIFQPADYFNEIPALQPARYFIQTASYPCLWSWQRLSKIIFLTTMPICAEFVSNNLTGNYGTNLKQNLLTDYEVPATDQSVREYLYYFNQGSFRYASFSGSGRLDVINLSVYYMDSALNMRQLMISPNNVVDIKIYFRKKKWKIYKEIMDKNYNE